MDRPGLEAKAAATISRQPLGSVIVPTDFSVSAEFALRRALLLPLAKGARIRVVHVLPANLPSQIRAEAEQRANQALEDLVAGPRAHVAATGTEVTTEVLWGAPFSEIIRESRSSGAKLIVLGRHGQRSIQDRFMGTTADRVVRTGNVPVLVVNSEPKDPYHSPLIATDLEEASQVTFEVALGVLGDAVDEVHVVHVFHAPFEGLIAPSASVEKGSAHRDYYREKAVAALDTFLEAHGGLGIRWETAVVPGDARTAILKESRRRNTDLLVVGTHGRSGVAHTLIGSVAEGVIEAATCDVLAVRPPRFSFTLP